MSLPSQGKKGEGFEGGDDDDDGGGGSGVTRDLPSHRENATRDRVTSTNLRCTGEVRCPGGQRTARNTDARCVKSMS